MYVGNYTLSHILGRGGTSEVYAAEHRFLGDAVAVKLLRPAVANDERVREAFVEEAARTREVQHPNVIRVLDFGHDPTTDSCYLVMERIEGESLSARLHSGGVLAEPVLRALAAAVADGMEAAHARGIVHRDLKPGNIMLRGETPIVVDFGIAKSLGATSAVVTERRIGTLAYMAPEQLAEGLITPAVDIWALGVILYEAATGRAPFDSFNEGRLPQLFETPPRPSTLAPISPALDELIMRCLARDPGKRPASMAQVARTLRGEPGGIVEERVTEDIGPAHVQRAALPPRDVPAVPAGRRSRMVIGVTAAALIGAGVLAIVMWPSPRAPSATASEAAGHSPSETAGQTTSATAGQMTSATAGQTTSATAGQTTSATAGQTTSATASPSATASGVAGQPPSATASEAAGHSPSEAAGHTLPATASGAVGQTPSATASGVAGQTTSATTSGAAGHSPSATASGAAGHSPSATASGVAGQTTSATVSPSATGSPSATASGVAGQTPSATASAAVGQPPSATVSEVAGQPPPATASGPAGQPPAATASDVAPPHRAHATKRAAHPTAEKPHMTKPGATKTPTTSQGETLD